jgi:hypothetical protein
MHYRLAFSPNSDLAAEFFHARDSVLTAHHKPEKAPRLGHRAARHKPFTCQLVPEFVLRDMSQLMGLAIETS